MTLPKIKVHTSFIGSTGYNNHAQSFFTKLSERVPLEIRNFTVGKTWQGMSEEPHNQEPYLTDRMKTLLHEQSLWTPDQRLMEFKMYGAWPNPGEAEIDLVLNETDHHYFYHDYQNYRIAYNVWETTQQPENFFKRLLEFDEMWVPSKWQRDCTIEQGYPAEKIFVIPEGVDTLVFYPDPGAKHELTQDGRFKFFLAGRWDYRKSTKEIVEAFLKTFKKEEPVDLIVSIDNPFSGDGLETTEKRLAHFGLNDDRIKVIHFPDRKEYVNLLKSCGAFLSCARSEGWNLPLIEAMACGVPAIYSNCSGQLEFAEGKGHPVKILGQVPARDADYNHFNGASGNYYEPDFEDLGRVMLDVYQNSAEYRKKAVRESAQIHADFNWDRVAELAANHIAKRSDHIREVNKSREAEFVINYHFVGGPHVEITGGPQDEYLVEFIDQTSGRTIHRDTIKRNMWVKASRKFYTDWRVQVTDVKSGRMIVNEPIVLKDRRVYISLDSSSLGDSLAWFPAVEEFRKKHGCQVVCSTHMNYMFKDQYPEIEFVNPGEVVDNIVAMYNIGWYYNDQNEIDLARNVREVKDQPMQKCAFDILGLAYQETRPLIQIPKVEKKKKIAIGIHGTCQAKYWNNPTGWQEVVDWCNERGYEVVLLSREEDGFMGNSHPTGIRKLESGPLSTVIRELEESQAFVGIGSGLSWLAWATTTPLILISGFSFDYTETLHNTHRICAPSNKCSGCFNTHRLDPGDWNWCPIHKGTDRMFECSKSIEATEVINKLKTVLGLI